MMLFAHWHNLLRVNGIDYMIVYAYSMLPLIRFVSFVIAVSRYAFIRGSYLTVV